MQSNSAKRQGVSDRLRNDRQNKGLSVSVDDLRPAMTGYSLLQGFDAEVGFNGTALFPAPEIIVNTESCLQRNSFRRIFVRVSRFSAAISAASLFNRPL